MTRYPGQYAARRLTLAITVLTADQFAAEALSEDQRSMLRTAFEHSRAGMVMGSTPVSDEERCLQLAVEGWFKRPACGHRRAFAVMAALIVVREADEHGEAWFGLQAQQAREALQGLLKKGGGHG